MIKFQMQVSLHSFDSSCREMYSPKILDQINTSLWTYEISKKQALFRFSQKPSARILLLSRSFYNKFF
jgi:hypothetical protein